MIKIVHKYSNDLLKQLVALREEHREVETALYQTVSILHIKCEYLDDACLHGVSLWDERNLL